MVDVFISYARRQRDQAEPLKARFEALGLDVFFDLEGIDGGSVFPDVITRALDSSKAVLTCWSPLYFSRPWCLIETREGMSRDVLVPVTIEAFDRTAPPADLRHVNYYDLTGWRGEDTNENWNRTLQRVGRLVGRELAPQLKPGLSGGAPIAQPASDPPPAVAARTGLLADLRSTWETFPARGNADAVARFLQRVQGAAPGSGLEFEVEHHLDELRRAAEAAARREAEETAARAAEAARRRNPGAEFRDGEGLPLMVTLPKGSFRMGSPDTERDRRASEGPVHDVRIRYALAVGKYPVTVGEFRRFIEATGHDTGSSARCWTGSTWEDTPGRGWHTPGFAQADSHPVTCVNWDDAQAYIAWAGKLTGAPYRLLSEAEWEYACRAGTKTRYAFGDEIGAGNANFNNSQGATTPAGAYPANAFGLCDLHGNASEWTQDCWNESYKGAPPDGAAWTSGDCSRRVVRGGSWVSVPRGLRSAYRLRLGTSGRGNDIGFRVARTL